MATSGHVKTDDHWPTCAGVPPPELDTVTPTAADMAMFPARSRAMAESEWAPFETAIVLQSIEYGALVISEPRFTPSSWSWTPVTLTLSLADAVTVTVPLTVVPPAGAVMATVGGVVS